MSGGKGKKGGRVAGSLPDARLCAVHQRKSLSLSLSLKRNMKGKVERTMKNESQQLLVQVLPISHRFAYQLRQALCDPTVHAEIEACIRLAIQLEHQKRGQSVS